MDHSFTAGNPSGTIKNQQIKSPGNFPRVIFTPVQARTRCQDPGRQFIRRRDKNAIQDRQRPRSHINARYNSRAFLRYAAVTLTGALYGVLCVAGMFYPVGPKTAHRGAQGRTGAYITATACRPAGIGHPPRYRQRARAAGTRGKQDPRPARGKPGIVDSRRHSRYSR